MTNLLQGDLEHILEHTSALLKELKGKSIFITGGTGFFGLWFLETIAWANECLQLNISAVILTRNSNSVKVKAPHLFTNAAFEFHQGDIRDFSFPDRKFDYVIHGATTNARETFNNEDSLKKFDTVAQGTRRLLEYCVQCDARKVLYISSGSCYGVQPAAISHIEESYSGSPDAGEPNAVLGIAKRTAEFYCHYFATRYDIEIKIARCFTFYGPHLPLDIHYAVGNFVKNGIEKSDIEVKGDGTPERSYLYIADLMIWLWTIFLTGENLEAYNVGSDRIQSISSIAEVIARYFNVNVVTAQTADPNIPANRYVPSVKKAREKLGLEELISFEEGIHRLACHIRADPDLYFKRMLEY